jgi:hypothetical protein
MRYLLLACLTAAVLSSCNKEQTIDVPKNRSQMLIGANTTNAADAMATKWKPSEYKVFKDDGTVESNWYPECLKDDYLQFFKNYAGKHLVGPNTCAANENDVYNTRWELTENETKFNCYDCDRLFGYRTFSAKMLDCSDSRFTIEYNVVYNVNGVDDTLKVELAFTKE